MQFRYITKEKHESKGKQGSSKEKLDKAATMVFLCKYRVACMISFIVLAGMCVFGSLTIIGMGFAKNDNGFNLALPFPDSYGVMGFFHLVELWIAGWFWNWVTLSLENSQGPKNPSMSFGGIAVNLEGGDGQIPQAIGE